MPANKPTSEGTPSDDLLLAALDRAERHQHREGQGVLLVILKAHLGLPHHSGTTLRLRPQLSRLQTAGLIERTRHLRLILWRLTGPDHARLEDAGRTDELVLPESPQHQQWATAQLIAGQRIAELRTDMRITLDEASAMLDDQTTTSDAWFALVHRLKRRLLAAGSRHAHPERVGRIRAVADLLGQSGRVLLLDRRPLADPALSRGAIEGALLAQVLGSPENEHEAWETLSALFYQGIPVDLFLRHQVNADGSGRRLPPPAAARARYLLARLMLKRGNLGEARTLLRQLDAELPAAGPSDRARLAALVRLRLLIESPESVSWRQREDQLLRTLAAVEDRSEIPEPVRAYEVASAVGREAMMVAGFLAREQTDADIASYFIRLTERHRSLIADYPAALVEKQEIVEIALATVGVLWGASSPLGDPEQLARLETMAVRGMVAARQRENAIFYSQMLIIIAIIARTRGDWPAAFRIGFVIGDVLQRGGIGTTHEGINALVLYARAYDPLLAEIISAAHMLGAHAGVAHLVSPATRPRAEARELLPQVPRQPKPSSRSRA